jgi:DNA-binding MarR family transcriptional regulator
VSRPDEHAARAWEGMRALVHDLHDRRKDVSAALDLSFFRVKVLRQLAGGPMTMRELGAKLGTDAPYITLLVRDLEQRELLRRTEHPTDRRAKLVTLTPAGRQAAERAERILNAPPAALHDLDPADLEALERIITTLLNKSG